MHIFCRGRLSRNKSAIGIAMVLSYLLCSPVYAFKPSKEIVFCYENKSFPPHFLGESLVVPEKKPGATIDILRELDRRMNSINFKFIRQPWSRCLKSLKEGVVGAVVGSYNEERATYGVYPMISDGVPNKSKAFDYLATCLIKRKGENIEWNNKEIRSSKAPSVAIPNGYAIKDILESTGYMVYQTKSLDVAYEMVKSMRVTASIINCAAKDVPNFVDLVKPPIREHFGYLILSKHFYRAQPVISEEIWQLLSEIDKKSYNQKYLN